MPIFKPGPQQAPAWGTLDQFDFVQLERGAKHAFERLCAKEKLVVVGGRCVLKFGDQQIYASHGSIHDLLGAAGRFEVLDVMKPVTLVRFAGRWGEEIGGAGLFEVHASDDPKDIGDPVPYPKRTNFDCHYHDCDEYWIMCEGAGEVVTEGKHYRVGPGDGVAIGMGHHHDFPSVETPVKAIWFETTMEGRKRRGHLYDHTHGKAEPKLDRV